MTNLFSTERLNMTQLTAINLAKTLTIVLLLGYAFWFGINDFRQIIYLCLHISYCLWWLLEQWFYPPRARQIFQDPVNTGTLIFTLLITGAFYSLPGYLAFANPEPISLTTVAIALPTYIFGTLINASADIQKLTAKHLGEKLVKDNIWRFSRNINYFGDLLRYLSFSIVSGSLWSYSLPGLIILTYLYLMSKKEKSMSEKYADFSEYKQSSAYFIPFIW